MKKLRLCRPKEVQLPDREGPQCQTLVFGDLLMRQSIVKLGIERKNMIELFDFGLTSTSPKILSLGTDFSPDSRGGDGVMNIRA